MLLLFPIYLLLDRFLHLLLVLESVAIVQATVSSFVVAAPGIVRVVVCSTVQISPIISSRRRRGEIGGLVRWLVVTGGLDILLLLLLLMVGIGND